MMKQLENYIGLAPKLKGNGTLEYTLWVDDNGTLFIQILKNNLPNATKAGTHTKLLLQVSNYLDNLYTTVDYPLISGFNLESLKNEKETDNNNNGFIKAILRHILPKN